MWLIVFMLAIVIPLIIWGFVAGRNEKKGHAEPKTV
jgi:hypothetical protein